MLYHHRYAPLSVFPLYKPKCRCKRWRLTNFNILSVVYASFPDFVKEYEPVRTDDDGAHAVAQLLSYVSTLRHVNMQCTELSEQGARQLLNALPDDDPLRCFELVALCISKISQRVPQGLNLTELSGSPRASLYTPRYTNDGHDEF